MCKKTKNDSQYKRRADEFIALAYNDHAHPPPYKKSEPACTPKQTLVKQTEKVHVLPPADFIRSSEARLESAGI